jgi:hypothetical protein
MLPHLYRPVRQVLLVLPGCLSVSLPASATTLEYVGVLTIPTETQVGGVEVGGFSSIAYV